MNTMKLKREFIDGLVADPPFGATCHHYYRVVWTPLPVITQLLASSQGRTPCDLTKTAWFTYDTLFPESAKSAVGRSSGIKARRKGSIVHLHIPCKKCKVSSSESFTFGCDWGRSLPECGEAVHLCSAVWVVGTGKRSISRFEEVFVRHLLRGHVPATRQSERGARHVRNLTERIVKIHAYPMACGGFSDVWCCDLMKKRKPPKRVAVKAIRPAIASKEEFWVKRKAVEQELNVWVGLKHRNVLPLYGVTEGFGPFFAFVCPWADNGTLSEYLEKFGSQLDLKARMILLGDIAAGLRYLHSRDIVHGDLSGSNVLITSKGRACLSDFGLSTLVEQVSDTTYSGISFPGNIRWAAPELFDGCQEGGQASRLSSLRADVYSFGSLMLHILSGKLPFHGVQRVAQIVIMISRGLQPPREAGWDGKVIPDDLWTFVEACWASPWKRPSIEDIVHFIGRQLSKL